MSLEARIAVWQLVVAVAVGTIYVALLLNRAAGAPITDAPYGDLVAWTVGGGVVAAIIGTVALTAAARPGERRTDMRDREIGRLADAVGASVVVIGAVAALVLAIFEVDHFWIGNAAFAALFASGLLSAIARIAMHRLGVPSW